MTRLARLAALAFFACLLLAACQTPSPEAEGRAQQESNDPVPLGDPGVPTHGM